MRLFVESKLPCAPDDAWDAVQFSALLRRVAFPLATFRAVDGGALPRQWQENEVVRCRCYLFGIIPLGERTLLFERIDHRHREIRTYESDRLVRSWAHTIRIDPAGNGECYYSDLVELDAGRLTPLVWLFAHLFYRYRQWRWGSVARGLACRRSLSPRPSGRRSSRARLSDSFQLSP